MPLEAPVMKILSAAEAGGMANGLEWSIAAAPGLAGGLKI
ncbi:hypothetical protein PATSB16_35780 [Pandoraea thiooxydans]|nr:hypothetical protein PATSB16_35780 [Pandoraea thiooxydans]